MNTNLTLPPPVPSARLGGNPPPPLSPPPPAPPQPVNQQSRHRFAAAVVVAAVALAFADASVVALALPDLYLEFEASISAVSWVLTAYALAVAVAGLVLSLIHISEPTRPY